MTSDDTGVEKRRKLACFTLVGLVLVAGLVFLLLVLLLKPSKAPFFLQDCSNYSFNLTQASNTYNTTSFTTVSCFMQLTIATRNSDGNLGIYYHKFKVFATYREQQVTRKTELPTSYLSGKETAVWSPFLYGSSVPVSPASANQFNEDMSAGWLLVYVRVDGRIKWKLGSLFWRSHKVKASCPAYLKFGGQAATTSGGNGYAAAVNSFKDCNVELY